ncbi:hypothetical protein T492DRAFT_252253 [Pavlovales sp. CCMP2436]|nr:hypothetical protein T492DRAFT_252253 [Pavlovales sp. CCMP2436]
MIKFVKGTRVLPFIARFISRDEYNTLLQAEGGGFRAARRGGGSNRADRSGLEGTERFTVRQTLAGLDDDDADANDALQIARVSTEIESMQWRDELPSLELAFAVDELAALAARRLWRYIVIESQLELHLEALRALALTARGDIFHTVVESGGFMMRARRPPTDRQLTTLLHGAIASARAQLPTREMPRASAGTAAVAAAAAAAKGQLALDSQASQAPPIQAAGVRSGRRDVGYSQTRADSQKQTVRPDTLAGSGQSGVDSQSQTVKRRQAGGSIGKEGWAERAQQAEEAQGKAATLVSVISKRNTLK